MKKYNLSKIMKRAWEIKKRDSRNVFSLCLKMAWGEAKKIKFNRVAKVAIVNKGETNPYIGTSKDSESNYFVFREWKKGNFHRIYINDYKGRSRGYIDYTTKALESEYSKGEVVETYNFFIENYIF